MQSYATKKISKIIHKKRIKNMLKPLKAQAFLVVMRSKEKVGVFMATDYHKSLIKDYEKLLLETERLSSIIKDQNNTIQTLNSKINDMSNIFIKKDEQISKLILEIERLKNNNDKDSSNSGKPSSKNGFKKIHNSRPKTTKKQGGQLGHKGSTTDVSKIKKLIEMGDVNHSIINPKIPTRIYNYTGSSTLNTL